MLRGTPPPASAVLSNTQGLVFGSADAKEAPPPSEHLLLPHHPLAQVEDPLDILKSDTLTAPAWRYVDAVLRRADSFTAAVSLLWPQAHWGTAPGLPEPGCKGLEDFLESGEGAPFRLDAAEWSRLREVALELPMHFPGGELEILHAGEDKTLHFSRRQLACLVVHQALCSLTTERQQQTGRPHWNSWWCNFGVWYQAAPSQNHNYLKSLFAYLKRVASPAGLDAPEREIQFARTRFADDLAGWQQCAAPLGEFEITRKGPQAFAGQSGFAQVDFANKDIGFGVSHTQEELMMGHNPELCASMLLAPTLRDDEAIVVRGTQVEADYSREEGALAWRPLEEDGHDWAGHEIIAIDALEMDTLALQPGRAADALIDLEPRHLLRELNKAHAGFSAVRSGAIVTGLWGCGSFGGAAQVKTLLQWMAASRAGKRLVFNLPPGFGEVPREFLQDLDDLIGRVRASGLSAGELLSLLTDTDVVPMNAQPHSIFRHLLIALDEGKGALQSGCWLDRKDLLSLTLPHGFKDASYGQAGQWGRAGAGVMMLDAARQRVLLFKRSADTRNGGLWAIPGGARSVREGVLAPALHTAITELREEAPPLPHGQLWSKSFEYRDAETDFSYRTFFMPITWPELYEPRLNWEHSECQWFEIDALAGRDDLHPGVIEAIEGVSSVLPERMNEIIPGLYVGNAHSARNLGLLKAHEIGHIINCASEDCPNVHEGELHYLSLALRDEPDSKITPLIADATATIKRALDAGQKVLVHCEMGRSRSVSMVMAYLIAQGEAPRQALNRVRERHPEAAPNRWFLDELRDFYQGLIEAKVPLDAD